MFVMFVIILFRNKERPSRCHIIDWKQRDVLGSVHLLL